VPLQHVRSYDLRMDGSLGDLLLSLIPLGIGALYPLFNEKARAVIRSLRRPRATSKIVVVEHHADIVSEVPSPQAAAK
jgi:hypothetical protein